VIPFCHRVPFPSILFSQAGSPSFAYTYIFPFKMGLPTQGPGESSPQFPLRWARFTPSTAIHLFFFEVLRCLFVLCSVNLVEYGRPRVSFPPTFQVSTFQREPSKRYPKHFFFVLGQYDFRLKRGALFCQRVPSFFPLFCSDTGTGPFQN